MLIDLHNEVKKLEDPQKGKFLSRFFKTGKGEYGEGDIFYGLTVPQSRKLAITYKGLPLSDVKLLLQSKIHEERLIALLILVYNFQKGDEKKQKEIYEFYLSQTNVINNWDLVDLSADKIIGAYLVKNGGEKIVVQLAQSENIWEKRIAMLATFAFIKNNQAKLPLQIADILLHDDHDLIQKAVGWMLREVGKRISQETEETFLQSRYKTMPRTALRYAIERFPEEKRERYLKGLV